MATQYEGHKQAHHSETHTTGKKGKKRKKKQKVMSAGFLAMALLFGIIFFAVCFMIGIAIGPNLPI